MAGTLSISGLGSGMDVNGMVDALVNASSINKTSLQSRVTETKAAATNISDIGSLLSKFQSAVDALSEPDEVASFAVSSSGSAISASTQGVSSSGKYAVKVTALAQEYRAYSEPMDSQSTGLGNWGTMSIQIGDGEVSNIGIEGTDSLSSIVSKINAAGLRVQATTLYDGSQYRLQLRGLDSGDDATVAVSGLTLGLDKNTKQQAQSAALTVDGISVTSDTNEVTGAIPGVSLTLSAVTEEPVNIEIKSDATSLKTKLQTVVDTYNAVIKKVHGVAGYGSTAASNAMLAGDSTLRQLTTKMSSVLMSTVDSGNAAYSTLRSLGMSQASDGTLTFDSSKLTAALSTDPAAVSKVLAGGGSSSGVMDLLSDMSKLFTRTGDGLLSNRKTTLDNRTKTMNERIDDEDARLARYRTQLETQFSAMDSSVSTSKSTMDYLSALYSSG
jgi:flagellar hook-associated protein 2